MASHAYPQAGAGPSSYYQQSPPPHHVYGNHSPGPRPNYHYSYPVPPPHLNSHQPPQFQQSPSRANHRHNVGGGGGTSYVSRGTHHYNNYHPTQHHQHNQFIQSHVSPQLGPHPQQQQQQHIPYSPQSAKYNHNQPYSPSYHYPSPTAPVFTPSWQTQQPISPLPKQLSMPPPQMPPPQNVQAFYEPSLAPPPGLTQSPEMPVVSIAPSSEDEIKTELPAPSTPTPGSPVEPTYSALPESLVPLQAPYTSTYSQMGTISTSDAVASASPPSSPRSSSYVSPSRRIVANPVAQWAIWSRRPQDPSHAPSIIISPRARPPPDVVQQAIDLKTPPQSQPSSPSRSATIILPAVVGGSLVVVQEETIFGTTKDEEKPQPSVDVELSTTSSSITSSSVVWSSQDNSTVPSSSVTEITDTPIVPGSPASSNTSLSLAGISLKDVKEPQTKSTEEITKAAVAEPETEASSPPFVVSLSTSAMSTTSSSTIIPVSSVFPSTVISHESIATTTDPNSIQTSAPTQPAAAHPAPATIKKSWADLLRPSTSSAPSSSASPSSSPATRNTLPTSSVVGFSIPAGSIPASSSSNPTVPVSPSEKSDLIALLTSGPSANSMTAGTNIRPRGIVNSGNMCYANSVLQVLVYCLPFQKLFVELGKVLPGTTLAGSVAGSSGPLVNGFGSASSSTSVSGSTSTLVNGLNGKEKDATGLTPLVDATVEFLGEFMDDKKAKSKAKKQSHSRKGSVHVNGSSSTSGVGGKGKEKEMRVPNGSADDGSEADWDACDSFLPTYVYDAMKSKKRFDHMKGGHQEDAEEFFGFYLETLEEELLSLLHAVNPPKSTKTAAAAAVEEKEEAAPPEDDGWMEVGKRNRTVITRMIKATESPITRIFSGRFRTTVRAPGQKDSATVDDWNLLRLDIQRDHIHTIQDALSSISHPQSVQLTQAARPGTIIEGQQQSLIEVLPPILVLQMKRFGYGSTGVAKVGKQVRFGPELEIGPDLMAPAAKKAHPQRYKLFGALYHHGLSASGGHYTLDVLHPNRYPGNVNAKTREGWVRIDDELVSDVRHDDVFGAYERDDARCAYLLFYRRI